MVDKTNQTIRVEERVLKKEQGTASKTKNEGKS